MSLALFVIFVALSALFSGTEMAYISRERVAHMARLRGKVGLFYGTRPREVLAVILLGNNLAIVGASAAAAGFFLDFFGRAASAALASVITTGAILIFGEIIPKALARSHPEGFMRAFALPVWWTWRATRPLVTLLLKMVRVKVESSPKSELERIVARMLSEGRIEKQEAKIAIRGLSLSEMRIGEAASRDFALLKDPAEARDLLRDNPWVTPVVKGNQGFMLVDAKALFSGKGEFLVPLPEMMETAPVARAVKHLRKGEGVAAVDSEGRLIGVLTPQSLLWNLISG